MSWVKLDDAILDNEKILRVGPIGFALHVAAICHCARNLTDGFIALARVQTLLDLSGVHCDRANPIGLPAFGMPSSPVGDVMDIADVVTAMVDAGLWHREPGGFRIHDYHEYQPTRAHVEATRDELRAKRSSAGKAGAASRWQTDGKRIANGTANPWQTDGPVPVPDPINKKTSLTVKSGEKDHSVNTRARGPRDDAGDDRSGVRLAAVVSRDPPSGNLDARGVLKIGGGGER